MKPQEERLFPHLGGAECFVAASTSWWMGENPISTILRAPLSPNERTTAMVSAVLQAWVSAGPRVDDRVPDREVVRRPMLADRSDAAHFIRVHQPNRTLGPLAHLWPQCDRDSRRIADRTEHPPKPPTFATAIISPAATLTAAAVPSDLGPRTCKRRYTYGVRDTYPCLSPSLALGQELVNKA